MAQRDGLGAEHEPDQLVVGPGGRDQKAERHRDGDRHGGAGHQDVPSPFGPGGEIGGDQPRRRDDAETGGEPSQVRPSPCPLGRREPGEDQRPGHEEEPQTAEGRDEVQDERAQIGRDQAPDPEAQDPAARNQIVAVVAQVPNFRGFAVGTREPERKRPGVAARRAHARARVAREQGRHARADVAAA